jgi:hypothetical protein
VAVGNNAGSHANTGFNNTICIGANTTANDSNQIVMGNSITTAYVPVAWTVSSDKRLKENIKTMNDGLSFITDLNPVTYNFINDSREKNTRMGLIAQEVYTSLNENQFTDVDIVSNNPTTGMLGLRYDDLIAPLISSVKQLKEENNKMKEEIKNINMLLEKNKIK